MKLLLIFALACLAVYETQAVSLKDALGMPEAHELDQVDNGFTDVLLTALTNFIDKLLDSKKEVGGAAEKVLEGFLDTLSKFKVDLGARVKKLLEEIKSKVDLGPLKALLAKLIGASKNNTLPSPANGIDSDEEIVKEIMEHILEDLVSDDSLEKLREYVENLAKTSKLEVVHALRELLTKVDNSKLRELIKSLLSEKSLERRGISEFFDHIRELIHKFGAALVTKFKPFTDWIIARWGQLKQLLSDKLGIIKAIATELLKHGTTISKVVAEEAKDLLSTYKEKLGVLYKPLMKKLLGIVDETTTPAMF
ncbi:hypothetical protein GQR58_012479 [Nymphon striatum]|nr:hypothetical protein GQR58_012479 [Nymphon striatum]